MMNFSFLPNQHNAMPQVPFRSSLVALPTRCFTKKTDKEEDYGSKFESLLNQAAKPITDSEKEASQ